MQKHTNHTHIIRIILMSIFAKERKYDTASNMHALTQTHTHSSHPLKLVLVSRGICIRVYFSVCLLFVQHILNNDILFICDFVFGWYGVKDIISAMFLCLPICACERVWLCNTAPNTLASFHASHTFFLPSSDPPHPSFSSSLPTATSKHLVIPSLLTSCYLFTLWSSVLPTHSHTHVCRHVHVSTLM